ncbi:MAG: hypothetical protein ACXV7J_06940 [Methylomonas sp.]
MTKSFALAVKPGAVALMGLMAATRFHHFGAPDILPDASLAIFFFAGLWLGGRYLFAALLLEAGLIDYLAITKLGVSDFCVSNAYVFLIGSYGAMWLGGKWCRQFDVLTLKTAAQQFAAMLLSTSIAFLFSNGSFYWLSGRYPEGSWAQYIERVGMYYPPYLTSTLTYGVVIFALVSIVKSLLAGNVTREAI